MCVTLDGDTVSLRAMMCSIANATYYGGGMRIAPKARIDDGLFDVCILAEAGKLEFLRAFPRVFKGTHTTHPKVQMRKARQIRIESEPLLPVLVDGEGVGTTPAEFVLVPGAITECRYPVRRTLGSWRREGGGLARANSVTMDQADIPAEAHCVARRALQGAVPRRQPRRSMRARGASQGAPVAME